MIQPRGTAVQRKVASRQAVVQQPLPLEEAVVPAEVPHVEPAGPVPEGRGGVRSARAREIEGRAVADAAVQGEMHLS